MVSIAPERPLPVADEFDSADQYVDSLLHFVTGSTLFQYLCGGIHILDFFTRDPDLYTSLLPAEWVEWMDSVDILDLLDLLMRADLGQPAPASTGESCEFRWKHYAPVPESFLAFIHDVRRHMLLKGFTPLPANESALSKTHKPTVKYGELVSFLPAHVTAGMTEKKIKEVDHFARFIDLLATELDQQEQLGGQEDGAAEAAHRVKLVDFGSGQNYLGRVLASEPYVRDIIGIETQSRNIEGAKALDIHARLAEKPRTIVNKKLQKLEKYGPREGSRYQLKEHTPPDMPAPPKYQPGARPEPTEADPSKGSAAKQGSIQYINHWVKGGDLSPVLQKSEGQAGTAPLPPVITISLHSCGNLVHHGLRTLTANSTVKAVALVGCCYNLMTERLTAKPTYKHPSLSLLRSDNEPNVDSDKPDSCYQQADPDGFPMSNRLAQYKTLAAARPGINLNITSRMMAVQAPYNWKRDDSNAFFTRHFFRALLQKIFVDTNVAVGTDEVTSPFRTVTSVSDPDSSARPGRSPAGTGSVTDQGPPPIVIGTLPKASYKDFLHYVRAAQKKVAKLGASPPKSTPGLDHLPPKENSENEGAVRGPQAVGLSSTLASTADRAQHTLAAEALRQLTDEDILKYEADYLPQRHRLACLWTLMAFTATVIEAVIVVDRWCWLKEADLGGGQPVRHAWVQSVFDGAVSPRNFCVVGVR